VYCEQENLKYVIKLIRNDVLERMVEDLLSTAHERYQQSGQKQRLFTEGKHQDQSWESKRLVIMKAG
jgi:hypothetical protein